MAGPLDPSIAHAVTRMSAALAHRGPDGDGHYVDRFAALGHRRLAIIDRAGGDQPLSNERQVLPDCLQRRDLQPPRAAKGAVARGHVFRTHSDTEAIVHAYEEYGTGVRRSARRDVRVRDLRFADARTLFLARDRVGKKPLFYGVFGGALHFASEIKALAPSPAWNGELDLDGLEGYLSLGYYLAPETAYRHVSKSRARPLAATARRTDRLPAGPGT